MNTRVNYSGSVRRTIAYLIDRFIILMLGGSVVLPMLFLFSTLLIFILGLEFDNIIGLNPNNISVVTAVLLVTFYIFIIFTLSIILEILITIRFGNTLGRWLFCVHIKNADDSQNASLMQIIIRCVSRDVIAITCIFLIYISVWFVILPI